MAPPKTTQQRADVQGLRAVAIFAVLLFHFFPEYFPNGFLGVDMFFVISGFLISSILSRATAFSPTTFASFYFRRSKRILPLYLVYICIAILLYSINAPEEEIYENQFSTIIAMIFGTNINSAVKQTDYFEILKGDNLFTHTWSLSAEMQYYFIVPFLFLIRTRVATDSVLYTHFFALIGMVSMVLTVITSPLFAFNMVFTRLWQFLATNVLVIPKLGSVAPQTTISAAKAQHYSLLVEDKLDDSSSPTTDEHRKPPLGTFFSRLVLVSLLLPMIPLIEIEPITARVVVVVATACIIVFGKDNENPILASKPFEFIGDISYSLYLFHWPFTVYFVQSTLPLSAIRLSLIPLSVLLTIIIYYAFEKHYRHWSKTPTITFIVVFYLIAFAMVGGAPRMNEKLAHRQLLGWQNNTEIEAALQQNKVAFGRSLSGLVHKECNYSDFRNDSKYSMNKPFGVCTMPNGTGKLKFAVIGNSYAPNQGDLVYKHFRPFFGSFRMFSQMACEVLAYTHRVWCGHRVNYTDVLLDYKPDVTFIIQRYFAVKNPLPAAGENDTELQEMVDHLNEFKNLSSLFFIMDSFPAPDNAVLSTLNNLILKGLPGETINAQLSNRTEDLTARPRTQKLIENCGSKCHLYDVEPGLRDSQFRFIVYDEKSHLALFEPSGHITDHGKALIEPVYEELAKKYSGELRDLEKKLHFACWES